MLSKVLWLTCYLNYSFQRAFCAFCQDRIWGLGRQGFKCIQCKLLVHKKCHKLVSKSCSNEAVDITASEETNGDNTPTTRKYSHYKNVSLSSTLILILIWLLLYYSPGNLLLRWVILFQHTKSQFPLQLFVNIFELEN